MLLTCIFSTRFAALIALACGLLLAAAPAAAHDTWLSLAKAAAAPGLLTFELSTGTRFPLQETGLPVTGVVRSGCMDAAGRAVELRPREALPGALLLRARAAPESALACWVQTRPLEVELTEALVQDYLKDVRAPPEIVATWEAQRQRGIAWRETYSKHARVEQLPDGPSPASGLAALRVANGKGLEILPLGAQPARVREELRFQLLEDGQPAAGLAVELVNERNPLGIWRRTDERGQIAFAFPFGGRWLLRAVRLAPPRPNETGWSSRFSTLVLKAF